MEDQGDGFAENEQLAEEIEQAFQEEPIRKDDDDDDSDDDESTPNGDSPMTSVANTIAMTTFAVHTLQPLIFYNTALTVSQI